MHAPMSLSGMAEGTAAIGSGSRSGQAIWRGELMGCFRSGMSHAAGG